MAAIAIVGHAGRAFEERARARYNIRMHELLKSVIAPMRVMMIVLVVVVSAVASGVAFAPYDEASVPTAVAEELVETELDPGSESVLVPEELSQDLSIVFVGDIMLDRNVYNATMRAVERGGDFNHPFELIAPELTKYDVRVANLEGPITVTPFNMKRAQAMSFTFDPRFVVPLGEHFDVVSLANNHTHNQGEKGLITTKKYLSDAGIDYFGDPLNRAGYTGRVFAQNGFRVGLIGYHAFGGPESKTIPVIEAEIKKMRADGGADYIVVMPHWGPEYKPRAAGSQVVAGHRFIDAGADAVIGGHPHVVQNVEEYKGRKIFYSLGNFIFDQYFSVETMEGIMVALTLTRDGGNGTVSAEFEKIPYKINKESQPYVPVER